MTIRKEQKKNNKPKRKLVTREEAGELLKQLEVMKNVDVRTVDNFNCSIHIVTCCAHKCKICI